MVNIQATKLHHNAGTVQITWQHSLENYNLNKLEVFENSVTFFPSHSSVIYGHYRTFAVEKGLLIVED
jgi:hypothetical protein